jgi:hypothetical protein
MLAALMAFSLITGSVWANEVRKLQEVSNDHG